MYFLFSSHLQSFQSLFICCLSYSAAGRRWTLIKRWWRIVRRRRVSWGHWTAVRQSTVHCNRTIARRTPSWTHITALLEVSTQTHTAERVAPYTEKLLTRGRWKWPKYSQYEYIVPGYGKLIFWMNEWIIYFNHVLRPVCDNSSNSVFYNWKRSTRSTWIPDLLLPRPVMDPPSPDPKIQMFAVSWLCSILSKFLRNPSRPPVPPV